MKKIGKNFKKYKLSILIAAIFLVIGIIGVILLLTFANKKIKIKEFENGNCKFKYDTTWRIYDEKNEKIILEHKNDSKLEIEIVKLEDEYKYSNISDIYDEIIYEISIQNKKFELISTKEDVITKNNFDGYKMLYENKDSQAMLVVAKSGDKLVLFTYESKNKYFDILLDSVHNIIYNFELVEEKYELSYNLKIETSDVKFSKAEGISKLLKNTNQYEMASNNYLVKYSIPDNFSIKRFDSTSGWFEFKGLENEEIEIQASVHRTNIYEYLEKESYNDWKTYKDDEDYIDFNESLDEFDSDYKSYIYKNSFYYVNKYAWDEKGNLTTRNDLKENIVLVYALDKNHLVEFIISSSQIAIPEELIKMIKIEDATNYSSYFDSKKEDGYIVSVLKRFVDYSHESIEEITLKIPDKYKEITGANLLNINLYQERNYALEYDERLEVYGHEVEYSINTISIDSIVEIANNMLTGSYGEYKKLTYVKDQTINNRVFHVYEGGETNISGVMFTSTNRILYYSNVKLLITEISNDDYLVIKITGNDREISETMLEELTNFDINIKNN